MATRSGQSPLDILVTGLASRQALIVLDNCEHLIGACAKVADATLRYCSEIRLLATSREPLGIAGETFTGCPRCLCPTKMATLARWILRLRRGRPVRGAGCGTGHGLCPGPGFCASGRSDLPAPRRHAIGDRAGGLAASRTLAGRYQRPARPAVPASDGRQPERPPAAADVASDRGLVVLAAYRSGTEAASEPVGVRRWVPTRCRGGGLRGRRSRHVRGYRSCRIPRR